MKTVTPAPLPTLPAGALLTPGAGEVAYGRVHLSPAALPAVAVEAVRAELARHYDGQWVWVTGHLPQCAAVPAHPACVEVLVAVAAVHRAAAQISAPNT